MFRHSLFVKSKKIFECCFLFLGWSSEEVPDNNCLGQHFVCGDGMCVPASARCDKEYNCYDDSDEENCKYFHTV